MLEQSLERGTRAKKYSREEEESRKPDAKAGAKHHAHSLSTSIHTHLHTDSPKPHARATPIATATPVRTARTHTRNQPSNLEVLTEQSKRHCSANAASGAAMPSPIRERDGSVAAIGSGGPAAAAAGRQPRVRRGTLPGQLLSTLYYR